jgi:hypothetical protein
MQNELDIKMKKAPDHHQNHIEQSRHQGSGEYTVALVCVAGIFFLQLIGSSVTENSKRLGAQCEKADPFLNQKMRCSIALANAPS